MYAARQSGHATQPDRSSAYASNVLRHSAWNTWLQLSSALPAKSALPEECALAEMCALPGAAAPAAPRCSGFMQIGHSESPRICALADTAAQSTSPGLQAEAAPPAAAAAAAAAEVGGDGGGDGKKAHRSQRG